MPGGRDRSSPSPPPPSASLAPEALPSSRVKAGSSFQRNCFEKILLGLGGKGGGGAPGTLEGRGQGCNSSLQRWPKERPPASHTFAHTHRRPPTALPFP